MPRGPMRNLLLGLLLLLALALTTVVLGLPNQLGDGIARELLEVFLIGGFACCMVLGWLGWRQGRDLSRAEHAGQLAVAVDAAVVHLDNIDRLEPRKNVLQAGRQRVDVLDVQR